MRKVNAANEKCFNDRQWYTNLSSVPHAVCLHIDDTGGGYSCVSGLSADDAKYFESLWLVNGDY